MIPRIKRVCGYCGGDGKLADGSTFCPHCKTHASTKLVSLYEKPTREFNPYLNFLENTKPFSFKEFDNYYKHLATASEFVKFRKKLFEITGMIVKGELPKTSTLLFMDNVDMLTRYVQTYLSTAVNSGLTVFPYLDTVTLSKLQSDKTFRLPENIYGIVDFYDIMTTDVVCLELTSDVMLYQSARLARYIILSRAKLNKPTMIISASSGSSIFHPDIMKKLVSLQDLRALIKSSKEHPDSCADVLYLGYDIQSKSNVRHGSRI